MGLDRDPFLKRHHDSRSNPVAEPGPPAAESVSSRGGPAKRTEPPTARRQISPTENRRPSMPSVDAPESPRIATQIAMAAPRV
jgi:hypothetical protein